MVQWEQEGLQNIPMWGPNRDAYLSEDEKTAVMEIIEGEQNLEDQVKKDCRALLEGGYDISKITDYNQFNSTIHLIEDAYGGQMDIQRQWNNQTEVSAAMGK